MLINPYANFSSVPTSSYISFSSAFIQSVEDLAEQTDALHQIETDSKESKAISYEALDDVPTLIGPLVRMDVPKTAPAFTKDEMRLPGFASMLEEGESFRDEVVYFQNMAAREMPAIADIQALLDEEGAGALERSELSLRMSTLAFLQGLAISQSDKFAYAPFFFCSAARGYIHNAYGGAAAISYHMMLNAFLRTLDTETESGALHRDIAMMEYGGIASLQLFKVLNLDEDYYSLDESDAYDPDARITKPYLYGLHYAKAGKQWFVMQALFSEAGDIFAGNDMFDEALGAYVASAWAFTRGTPVADVNTMNLAMSVLRNARQICWEQEKRAIDKSMGELEKSRVINI